MLLIAESEQSGRTINHFDKAYSLVYVVDNLNDLAFIVGNVDVRLIPSMLVRYLEENADLAFTVVSVSEIVSLHYQLLNKF